MVVVCAMSAYSLKHASEDIGKDDGIAHEFDELVAEHAAHITVEEPTVDKWRRINFIMDHSAFARGIGNIKRWLNSDYIKSTYGHMEGVKILLTIHIPSYTLHEFDYAKKGSSMIATNVREAIKFIDLLVGQNDAGAAEKVVNGIVFRYSLNLELQYEQYPSWHECVQNHKVYSPKVREFPNFKTKFDSHRLGINEEDGNDIQYENSELFKNALAHENSPAEIPSRLKFLIRSCIKQQQQQQHHGLNLAGERWRLVTEDPITKIWAISFGIDCFNINEAELMVFQDYDINGDKVAVDPHFIYQDEQKFEHILHNTIDSTVYEYHEVPSNNIMSKRHDKRHKNKKKSVAKAATNEGVGINGGIVRKERFDAINYAPRGSGELWGPGT